MKNRVFSRKITFFLFLGLILFVLLSCESKKDSEFRSKTNTPPVVLSVAILPEKAYVGTELSLAIQSNDLDGDPITYEYQWLINDQEMTGENKSSLKGDRFKKGDVIRARVTPSDGKKTGRPSLSLPVKILNSPPEVREVSIEPKRPAAHDTLKAEVKSFDADGDFVYYSFRWEKNGEVIPDEKAPVLEQGRFKKGDSVTVTVVPDDREIQGTPKKSEPALISSSPPVITSSPPISVERTAYRYQVKVDNPDQSPITFTLKSGPKGMAIDKDAGLILWEIKREDKGTYPVEIEVSDSEGAKSTQRYSLRVDFK